MTARTAPLDQYVSVDFSNPLAFGLEFLCFPGVSRRNLVGGSTLAPSVSTALDGNAVQGKVLVGNNSGYISFSGLLAPKMVSATVRTFAGKFRTTPTTPAWSSFCFVSYAEAWSKGAMASVFNAYSYNGVLYTSTTGEGGTGSALEANLNVDPSMWNTVAYEYNPSGVLAFCNGKQHTSTGNRIPDWGGSASNYNLGIGGYRSNSVFDTGWQLEWSAMWSRGLSPGEHFEVARNPYQLLLPVRRKLIFPGPNIMRGYSR